MEDKDNPWTSESPMRISKMGNQNVSIVTSTDIWQRNTGQRRKRGKQGNVSNVMKKNTLLSYASPLSRNNIPAVKPPPNHTSPPPIAATFLATCLMAVLQSSGYSVFHDRDTPIQLSFP